MNSNIHKNDLVKNIILYKKECIICFELIQEEVIFNCSHSFCKNCILKWIRKGEKTCPVCRNNIIFINFNKKRYNIEEFKNIDSINTKCFLNPTVINFLFSIFCLLFIYIIHKMRINNHQQAIDYNENEFNENKYNHEYNLG